MKRLKKFKVSRLFVIEVVFLLLLFILIRRIFQLQIIDGKTYMENFQQTITRTLKTKAVRGNIYDCKGQILASNKVIYTVTMIDSGEYRTNRERQLTLNGIIYHLLNRLHENGEELNNEIKIALDENGNYVYTAEGAALERFKADIYGQANPEDMSKEQSEIEAEEMIQYLAGNDKFALYGEGNQMYTEEELKTYGLKQQYSKEQVLEIIGIRYMLSLNAYRKYQSVTIAKDVSEETMAYVLENNELLLGVQVEEDWERVYEGGDAFAHILGYVGKISSEELDSLQETNPEYTTDSIVGKAGIEQYMETELQGTEGKKEITVNNVGKIIGDYKVISEASIGKNISLTIDKDLQTAVYNILEQNIAEIVYNNLINAKEFDKERINDTTEIRIPVYDVYNALVQNDIIKLNQMVLPDATKLEQKIAGIMNTKEKAVLKKIKKELEKGSTPYNELSKEMKKYAEFIVSESGILEKEKIDSEDSVYISWLEKGEISLKEFLYYAIEKNWINLTIDYSEQKYYTQDEIYSLLVQEICKSLQENRDIEKTMFYYLLLSGAISDKEVCELLYDQGVLSKKDEDYKKLKEGQIDTFSFIRKKIKNLEITPAQLALDPCSGSAVVIQAGTGKVLACVSYPGYDNNRLANEMDSEYYNELLLDKSLPLYNRATQQLTAPGSTLKPITIIAGLQEKVISSHTSVFCDGIFDEVTPSLKCWKHSGHGEVKNAATAIQYSCNDYLCEIAYRLGKKESGEYDDNQALSYLQRYAKLFDLDKKSGIEIVESNPHVTDSYGIPSAIGQGTHNYTTVQLARYTNTLASKGNSFSLSVIQGIEDTNGKIIDQKSVLQSKIALSDHIWDTVNQGMVQFAQNNTILKEMPINIAGKTGTAQETKNRPDHALFIGYAPVEEPEISIAVRIANGYSSSNAVYVGRDIMNYYFELEDKEKY